MKPAFSRIGLNAGSASVSRWLTAAICSRAWSSVAPGASRAMRSQLWLCRCSGARSSAENASGVQKRTSGSTNWKSGGITPTIV